MKKILLFFALSFPAMLFGQVVKTAAVPYTKGASPYTPTLATSAEIRVDTSCSCIYWWDRDNLTWMRMRPGIDVITGGVAPAYKPHDNQSLFAINADSELYYYTGSAWVLINGTGTGGIYGGSGNVPDNTVPTLLGSLDFSGGDLSSFSVATGTTVGGAMSSSFSGFAISQRDTSGSTLLDLTGNGAAFYFPGSFDRLTINDRDARYGADYSATYSDRSLPDVAYVNDRTAIPSTEIAFGNATDDGIESSPTLVYEDPELTLKTDLPIVNVHDESASSSTGGGLLRFVQNDGAALSSGHRIGGVDFLSLTDGSGGSAVGAQIQAFARSNWSSGSAPTYLSFLTTNLSSTTPHEKMRLTSTALGTNYRLELRDRTTLDFYTTGNAGNGRIEVVDTAMYIIPPEVGGLGETGIYGKIGFEKGSTSISSDVDDLYLGAGSSAMLIEIAATGATRTITGIQPGMATGTSRLLCLYNSGSEDVVFSDQDAGSAAANQFNIGGNYTLEPGVSVWLFHVSNTTGWIMPARSDASVGGLSDGDYGDITVSGAGTAMDIDAGVVGATELASLGSAGSCTNCSATIDADGRVSAYSSGATPLTSETNAPPVLYPSQITADQNHDYSPTGYSTTVSQTIQVDGDGGFCVITGIAAATRNGVEKTFDNDGTNCYLLAKQHTGSSAGNRFDIPKDIVVYPGMQVTLRYDSVGADWRLKSSTEADIVYGNVVKSTLRNNTSTATTGDGAEYTFTANGGTVSQSGASGTTNRLRTILIQSNSANTTFPTVSTKSTVIFLAANVSYIRVFARIRTDATLSDATNDYDIRLQIKGSNDTTISEGAYINYQREENSGGWTLKTHDGSTPNSVNAGAAIATNTYYNLELIYYPYGEVTAFINGTRYTTTSNLPTLLASSISIQVDRDNGTTGRGINLEAFDIDAINVSE